MKLTNKKIKMKKVFSIIAVAALATSFVACGPSADEKAKMEAEAKAKEDSIKRADSIANAATMEATVDTTAATTETAAATTETAAAENHGH
jgi:hypothetical protein